MKRVSGSAHEFEYFLFSAQRMRLRSSAETDSERSRCSRGEVSRISDSASNGQCCSMF
jgi:hypothetical protein